MDKKNGHLTTFDVTIPTSVLESLDYIVSQYQEENGEVNRNGVISYLIQKFYVDEGYYDNREALEEVQELTCDNCEGTGKDEFDITCSTCEGSGHIIFKQT